MSDEPTLSWEQAGLGAGDAMQILKDAATEAKEDTPADDGPRTDAPTTAEVSHVIVRACRACGHPRQIDTPCAGCGLTQPPEVSELGVVSATYSNPAKQLWWRSAGQWLAYRRIRRANRRAQQLRAKE